MDKGLNSFSHWSIPESEVAAIRQYLLFRGLSSTTKTFENEIKQDRDKHLMVEKIIDQIQSYISLHDILNLRDYWNFLEQRVFLYADPSLSAHTQRLWTGVLRIYICHTATTARQDKLIEFFEKMAPYLIGNNHADWRDWFVLPYVKNAEEKSQYALYFNKQWQDTLFLSLSNFLSIVINNLPRPVILDFERSEKIIEELKKENINLKSKIDQLMQNQIIEEALANTHIVETESSVNDLLPTIDDRLLPDATENSDDFINISQSSSNTTRHLSTSSFVSMIKNLGSAPQQMILKPSAKINSKKSSQNDKNISTSLNNKDKGS